MRVHRPRDPTLAAADEIVGRIWANFDSTDPFPGGSGSAVDGPHPFVLVPRILWTRLRRPMRRLAGEVGLTIKAEHRYDIKRELICLRIVRTR